METIVVPDRELDIMGVDPLAVMAWEESPWYCHHWDVPWISKWNECIDFMWSETTQQADLPCFRESQLEGRVTSQSDCRW